MDKKVAIIGGAGFIGSHATKKFLDLGYSVKVGTRELEINFIPIGALYGAPVV